MTIRALFFVLGAAVSAAVIVIFLAGTERQATDQERDKAREAAFARLSADRHTIDRIEFFGWNADSGSAGIVIRGNRGSDYHISWQVTEPTNGQVLAQGREMVSLGPGRRTVVIGLKRGAIIAAYREKVLKDAGGVKVDEAFHLAATAEPALNPEESAALPPREVQNLAIGQSSLRSGVGIDLHFSFQLPAAPAVRTD